MENNVAVLLGQLGRNAEAKAQHQHALSLMRRLEGPDHPMVAGSLDNLGIVLLDLGQLEEAERAQREALTIRVRAYGENTADVAKSLNNLGRTLNMAKRYPQARQVLERALSATQTSEGPDHPMSAWVLLNMGSASLFLHEPKRALEEFTRGYEILIRNEATRGDQGLLLLGMADANLGLQRPDQALALLDRASPSFTAEDTSVENRAMFQFARARTLRALHRDPARQRALAEEARSLYERSPPVYKNDLAEVRAFLDSERPRP
jgi:Tfp pilus assembly protein PilF